jgi:hypothetical protein
MSLGFVQEAGALVEECVGFPFSQSIETWGTESYPEKVSPIAICEGHMQQRAVLSLMTGQESQTVTSVSSLCPFQHISS